MILMEEYAKNIVEVKRVQDRVCAKLEIEGVTINIACGYTPQVGGEMKDKGKCWSELDGVVERIPREESVVIGADVGEGDEEWS